MALQGLRRLGTHQNLWWCPVLQVVKFHDSNSLNPPPPTYLENVSIIDGTVGTPRPTVGFEDILPE